MAGVAEKARFYLERAVPQLREFEDKEIFSKDEIRSLVKQRTDFEHRVLAPDSTPAKYLAYIAWETSVETLRAKRCRRLHIRQATNHAGQARTLQTFERAVRRHPGDVALWRAYLDYAASIGASRRWRRVMTAALRMHPTEPALWVAAGRRAAREDGDMEAARAMFMRGCRFCNASGTVWVEYARVEMEWLVRMERKKGTKGFVSAVVDGEVENNGNMVFEEHEDDQQDDFGADAGDGLLEPMESADRKTPKVFSKEVVTKLERSPAMDGAIPRAIYDIATKQAFFKVSTAEAFFDMFSEFTKIPAGPKMLEHVLASMIGMYPTDASTCSCQAKRPIVGLDTNTSAFPKALRETLAKLKEGMATTDDKSALAKKTMAWMEPILATEFLDLGIRTVLEHTQRSLASP